MAFRDTSPVFVSVETTSYAIPNIPFPAISICSVNKLEEDKLKRALDGIKKDKKEYMIDLILCVTIDSNLVLILMPSSFDSVDEKELKDMLDAMIRYESVDLNGTVFTQTEEFSPSDLLRVFKSVRVCKLYNLF